MFRSLKNRYDRGRVFWISHCADGNADQRRQLGGFPIDRRAALWTKIVMHFPAACGGVRKFFRGSRDGDSLSGVISAYSERRACPALAVDAVTSHDYPRWFFRQRERDCAADASCVAHRRNSLIVLGPCGACRQGDTVIHSLIHRNASGFAPSLPMDRHSVATWLSRSFPQPVHRLVHSTLPKQRPVIDKDRPGGVVAGGAGNAAAGMGAGAAMVEAL